MNVNVMANQYHTHFLKRDCKYFTITELPEVYTYHEHGESWAQQHLCILFSLEYYH